MSEHITFYRRVWLNRPRHHSSAHVIAHIGLDCDAEGRSVDAYLQIADCRRTIRLDFDLYDDDGAHSRHNGLHKARVLRDVLVAFTESLEAAYTELAERRPTVRPRPDDTGMS